MNGIVFTMMAQAQVDHASPEKPLLYQLVSLAIPCVLIVFLVAFVVYALMLQHRGLRQQSAAIARVDQSTALQRQAMDMVTQSLAFSREQVRLLRKLAGEPELTSSDEQRPSSQPGGQVPPTQQPRQ